jgi:hypothetical protein
MYTYNAMIYGGSNYIYIGGSLTLSSTHLSYLSILVFNKNTNDIEATYCLSLANYGLVYSVGALSFFSSSSITFIAGISNGEDGYILFWLATDSTYTL